MTIFQNLAARIAVLYSGLSLEREEGQTLAEYALILALIAVACTFALIFLGGKITSLFSDIGNQL